MRGIQSKDGTRIVIIGAGPTGLGAAWRLMELGHPDWMIYEKNDYVGGLSASFRDEAGFTWDVGGHVMFSHYPYFDAVVDRLLGGDYLEHERESWIRIAGRWVPYPFQNNVRYLPPDMLMECLTGLLRIQQDSSNPANFEEWIHRTFGEGIANSFMIPYNRKVWAWPPDRMDKNWIAERVSVIDLKRILENLVYERDDVKWGPNNTFLFPREGGTGGLFRRIEPILGDHLAKGRKLVSVNEKRKRLTFDEGQEEDYDILINTSPLDLFVASLSHADGEVKASGETLVHNHGVIVGVGVEKRLDSTKCWMYFPEETAPFYRMTHFSNYSPENVPGGDVERYSSYMCEISWSDLFPIKGRDPVRETIDGLIRSGILGEEDRKRIVSVYRMDVDYSYPVPSIGRDRALGIIQPYLESRSIFSRGRFGAWKYEIGNMDHSFMQGVETVNRVLEGEAETTWSL